IFIRNGYLLNQESLDFVGINQNIISHTLTSYADFVVPLLRSLRGLELHSQFNIDNQSSLLYKDVSLSKVTKSTKLHCAIDIRTNYVYSTLYKVSHVVSKKDIDNPSTNPKLNVAFLVPSKSTDLNLKENPLVKYFLPTLESTISESEK